MNILYMMSAIGIIYGAVNYTDVILLKLYSLLVNMVYWYSYLEVKIKSFIKLYICDSSEQTKPFDNTKTIYYLTNNELKMLPKSNEGLTDVTGVLDVVFCFSNGLFTAIDLIDDTNQWISDNTKSETEFINVSVKFKDETHQYSISFHTDNMDLYAVDNKINKYIIWYLVKQQHNVNYYDVPYSVQLMDHNVNMMTLCEESTIIITKPGYHVV